MLIGAEEADVPFRRIVEDFPGEVLIAISTSESGGGSSVVDSEETEALLAASSSSAWAEDAVARMRRARVVTITRGWSSLFRFTLFAPLRQSVGGSLGFEFGLGLGF